MKFGVVLHKTTTNIGDDIQSYAAAKLLPAVDYVIERENVDSFRSRDNEPVCVLMNAWWLWKKWNWPPADCIIPMLTSMHINNYTVYRKSSPIYGEWLTGCGGEFLKEYGPVGCRDQSTLDFLKEQGVDCYFSGCLTLTLPQQKKVSSGKDYVCLVDLNPKLERKARELLEGTGLEIRVMSHKCDYRDSNKTLEQRFAKVEEVLTQYQNAKFVITRRLHVTLPCLALGTPVLSVVDLKDIGNTTRWEPYVGWLHCVDNEVFLNGEFDFDFNHPPENKSEFIAVKEKLIRDVADFVAQYEKCELSLEDVRKTSYTLDEKIRWQNEMMKTALDKWLIESRKLLAERDSLKKKVRDTSKKLKSYKQFIEQIQADGYIGEAELPEINEDVPDAEPSLLSRIWKKVIKTVKG